MKILFICGSLEPGRDGVGDYTRRLAGELVRHGHTTAIVALYDRYVNESSDSFQLAGSFLLPVLRVPTNLPANASFEMAKGWLQSFNPDWVSLQFVPYSFHPKGLPIFFCSNFKILVEGYPLHIMFHELWVGINSNRSFKVLLLGTAQKFLIKRLIHKVKPNSLTTTIPLYKNHLSEPNIRILPLFGNIPICSNKEVSGKIDNDIRAIHFGGFTGSTHQFELQLQYLKKLSIAYNRKIRLIVVGEGGAFKDLCLTIAKNLLGEKNIAEMGRLSPEEISRHLLTSDIGISRADYDMAGKSGSTLAMIEHGLPVLIRGEDKMKINKELEHPVFKANFVYHSDKEPYKLPKRRKPKSYLNEVSQLFLTVLNQNKT